MPKAAIVVLAGTETHSDLGRLTNALTAAKEFADAGDDVEVIFDGAGTQWIPELADPDHDKHALYRSLEDHVSACEYCAGAFGVEDSAEAAGVDLLGDHDGHPSVRDLVADDYEIITF